MRTVIRLSPKRPELTVEKPENKSGQIINSNLLTDAQVGRNRQCAAFFNTAKYGKAHAYDEWVNNIQATGQI
jgi:hypothetical protein